MASDTYLRGRPDYPPAVNDWLRDVVGLGPGRVVLDVGAGTGKFLPYLLSTGAQVIALEPVAAMRDRLSERFDVQVLAGTAEAIDRPDESLDAVVCAQAFHWFSTADAVAEMCRVLRRGGTLGLVWNTRDATVSWVSRINAIVDRYQGDTPRFQSGDWRKAFPAPGLRAVDERHARQLHTGPADQVIVDRILSTSFIAALPSEEQQRIERELRLIVADTPALAGQPEVSLPYDTVMLAFRKD